MAWRYHNNDPLLRPITGEGNSPLAHWPMDAAPEPVFSPTGGPYLNVDGAPADVEWAYRLDDASGDIQDSGPNGYDGGTASGATYASSTNDWLGQQSCMSFDGTNDYVDGADAGWSDEHTVTYWVYVNALAADAHLSKCVSGSVTGVTGKLYDVEHTAGGLLQIQYLKTAGSPATSAATMFAAGYWHFVALSASASGADTVIRASVYRLGYADGAGVVARENFTFTGVQTSSVAYAVSGGTTRAWALACSWNTGARTAYLNGKLMDIRFYDGSAFDDDVIDELYYYGLAGLRDTVGDRFLCAGTVDSTYRAADVVPGLRGFWADGSTVLVDYYGPVVRGERDLSTVGTAAMIVRPTRYAAAGSADDLISYTAPGDEGSDDDNTQYAISLAPTTNELTVSWESAGQVDESELLGVVATALVPVQLAVRMDLASGTPAIDTYAFGTQVGATITPSGALPAGPGSEVDLLASAPRFRVFGGMATGTGTAFEGVMASLILFATTLHECQIENLWTPGSCPVVIPPAAVVGDLAPTQGATTGGTRVVMRATNLHLASAQDTMTDATALNAEWTSATTGTGYWLPTASGVVGYVQAAASATSTATLTWTTAELSWHAEVDVQFKDVLAMSSGSSAEIGLTAYANASTYAQIMFGAERGLGPDISGKIIIRIVEGGTTRVEHELPVRYTDSWRLGVMRHDGSIVFFVNYTEVLRERSPVASLDAQVRLDLIADDGAKVFGRFSNYLRLPIVVFGSDRNGDPRLARVLYTRTNRAIVVTPPSDKEEIVEPVAYAESFGETDGAPITFESTFEYADPYESVVTDTNNTRAYLRSLNMRHVATKRETESE